MKSKPVVLTVTGFASNVGEEDGAMRLITTGVLSGKQDSWKLRYTEMQPETNEKHRITMTMDNGVVTMIRDGAYGTNMVFEKGHRYESSYKTPFGALDMGIYSTLVKYDVGDDGNGEVKLKYQLDLQGQYTSFHDLKINIKASDPL